MSRNPNRSEVQNNVHDNVVSKIANDLQTKGYTVAADHINWPTRPPLINGHRPDVLAVLNSVQYIYEIETCETYCDDHTEEQLNAFVNEEPNRTYCVVPKSCLDDNNNKVNCVNDFKKCLEKWGLQRYIKILSYNTDKFL